MGKLTVSELAFWKSEADSCIERQKRQLIERNNYPFLLLYYEGFERIEPIYPHVSTTQRIAIINEYFPNTNALISELMYQNPDIIAEAAKPEAEGGEELIKAALAYGFDKSEALIENRVALFDMFYAGYCAVEVDHINLRNKKDLELLPDRDVLMGDERKTFMEKVKAKFKGGSEEKAEIALEAELPPDESAYATNEGTYIRRWDPIDVPLDWRADRLKDRRYNLKMIWMSKSEFDAKYPEFKDKVSTSEREFEFSKHDLQKHINRVLLYEFQIKKKRSMWTLVMSPTLGTEEIDLFERPYVTNGFNMKIGTLHKYGKLYPISFAQVNKVMQDELNNYVRHMKDVAERNVPKRVYDKIRVKGDAITAMNSRYVNDSVGVDGNPSTAIAQMPHTNVSVENKELLSIFGEQKEKLWSISSQRLGGRSKVDFATELEIQEAGFQSKNVDLQEGLRFLIKEELETYKDIIVNFWDGEYFFKVTGGDKPVWYQSNMVDNPMTPGQRMVDNPLTDILTGDYFIKVNISSALRPNKERRKKEIIDYLTWLLDPARLQYLAMHQLTVNPEEIKKSAKEFDFNPETLLIPLQPPQEEAPAEAPQELSEEEQMQEDLKTVEAAKQTGDL